MSAQSRHRSACPNATFKAWCWNAGACAGGVACTGGRAVAALHPWPGVLHWQAASGPVCRPHWCEHLPHTDPPEAEVQLHLACTSRRCFLFWHLMLKPAHATVPLLTAPLWALLEMLLSSLFLMQNSCSVTTGGIIEIFLFILVAGFTAHVIGASVHEGIFVGALVSGLPGLLASDCRPCSLVRLQHSICQPLPDDFTSSAATQSGWACRCPCHPHLLWSSASQTQSQPAHRMAR